MNVLPGYRARSPAGGTLSGTLAAGLDAPGRWRTAHWVPERLRMTAFMKVSSVGPGRV